MMNTLKIFSILAVFFVFVISCLASASDRNNFRKKATTSKQDTERESQQVEETPIETTKIVVDTDMRFGKIVRIQDNVAFVQIISKIPKAELPPKFLACDYRLEPVAELESMHIGFRNCFLFKIIRGNAQKGDNVIVRYFGERIEILPKQESSSQKVAPIHKKN